MYHGANGGSILSLTLTSLDLPHELVRLTGAQNLTNWAGGFS